MKKINFLTLPGNESSPPQPIQVNSRKSVCEMIGSLSSHAGKNEDYTNFDVTKTPISSNAFGCTTTEDFSSFSEKHYKHDNTPTTQEDTPPQPASRETFIRSSNRKISIAPADLEGVIKGDIGDHYELQEIIGEGAFGLVSRAVSKRSGVTVAIKTTYMNKISAEDRKKFFKEYDLLKRLDHPNIIKIFEVIYDDKKFNMVTEFHTGGELFEIISAQGTMPENRAAIYTRQILSAMAHMHDR